MTTHRRPSHRPDPLDTLAERLVECGSMLSLMISNMMEFQAAGRSAPDADPIPDVIRRLVRDVIEGLTRRHSAAELSSAAAIVREATETIGNDILFVSPDAD